MSKRVGVDIDGVLANFCEGYAEIITRQTGIEFPDLGKPEWPPVWYWDRAAGLTPEQEKIAWDEIKSDPLFWYKLNARPGAERFLHLLTDLVADIYFITDRPGWESKLQTELWLVQHGFGTVPTVLISRNKAALADGLNLTYYLDDKTENCVNVKDNSTTEAFMLAAPYNAEVLGIPRLPDLEAYWDIISKEEVNG